MNWGVLPILYSGDASDLSKIDFGIQRAEQLGYIRSGTLSSPLRATGRKPAAPT